MIIYKFKEGCSIKITTNSTFQNVEAGGLEVKKGSLVACKSINGYQDNSFSIDSFSIIELANRDIDLINDPGYDTERYDLTEAPTDTLEGDSSYTRSYSGALTEKSNYVDIKKANKKIECENSWMSQLQLGYTHDNTLGFVIKMKCHDELKNINSLDVAWKDVEDNNVSQIDIKDYEGALFKDRTLIEFQGMCKAVTAYYREMKKKKWRYESDIGNAADIAAVDVITFDWAIT